jgi:hypothetical protein
VLEFDEEEFSNHFPSASFGDVDYLDTPDQGLEEMLARAYHIGKPRYHFFLIEGVLSAAYFSKQTCWSYEQERRLVLTDSDIQEKSGIMLVKFPTSCITAVISGKNAAREDIEFGAQAAQAMNIPHYELKIGRSTGQPYFVDAQNKTSTFSDGAIALNDYICEICKEPVVDEEEVCSWCKIEDEHENDAASHNPLRMLNHFGMLEEWYSSMRGIANKKPVRKTG